jgi:branched-chain amino acid transport system substrate-binding protein
MLISYDLPARPEFWKTLGDKGTYVAFIVYYHPTMRLTPRGEAFRTKYRAEFKEDPVYGALNAYTQVALVAEALNLAHQDSGEALVKALLSHTFEGWNATISFSRGEGPYWQQWTPPMLFTQYTKPEMPFAEAKIIFPPEFKTGDLLIVPTR